MQNRHKTAVQNDLWLLTGLILALSSLWVYYKQAIGIAAALVMSTSLGSLVSKRSPKLATAVPYALYISCAAQSLLMAAGRTSTCVMTTVSVACSHIQGTLTVPLAAWNMSNSPAMASALYTTVSACNHLTRYNSTLGCFVVQGLQTSFAVCTSALAGRVYLHASPL